MKRLGLVLVLVVTWAGCTREKAAPASDRTAAPTANDASAASPSPTEKAAAKTGADDAALRAECCTQCAGAAKRDPAGMDISTKDCRSYAGEFNGGPGVDEKCLAHFVGRATTVGDCWKEQPSTK